MSTLSALPSGLRNKLAGVVFRIRLLRALRGASLLVLVLTLTAGAALLADYCLGLPALPRTVILAAWLGVGAFFALFGLLVPLCRPLDPEALAAVVEEKYPDLGERLTSAVELAGDRDAFHGSPALIALLLKETEAQTHPLDFLRAIPFRASAWLAAVAALALLLALSPALLWPDRYAELGRRFFIPWRTPGAGVLYTLEVSPGNTFAAKGRPLTVSVYVNPLFKDIALPRTSTLILTDDENKTSELPMPADRPDEFSVKLDKVLGNLRYSVKAEDAVSETYQVTAIDPVELASESPTSTITPPDYAKGTIETRTSNGMVDLSGLQYSRVHFDFRFTCPAVAATLEWSGAQATKEDKARPAPKTYPLELSNNRDSASVELPAREKGTYRLILDAEQGIRTEVEPRLLTVKLDEPPVFTGVTSSDKPLLKGKADGDGLKVVQPFESIPLEFSLTDDVGVDRLDLEYRVNDGDPQTEPIPLQGRGTQRSSARYLLKLDGKVKDGDVVRYRFKVQDNRQVPEAGLGPNVVFYPADPRWLVLKISRQAEPLGQQDVLAQRDDINERVESIQRKLREEKSHLQKLSAEVKNQTVLKPQQAIDLDNLGKENRAAQDDLRELAREAEETSALQEVADRAKDIADSEMQRSHEGLQQASKETKSEPRNGDLKSSAQELNAALQRLDDLRRRNEQLAQARLDQMKLEALAEKQQHLAEKTADEAKSAPPNDLKQEEGELAKELQRQVDQSETLRNAVESTAAEKSKQLADQARRLAQAERDLVQAEQAGERKQNQERLSDLAHKQQELAEQTARLARETHQPTQVAKTPELKPEDAQKAADALKEGNAPEALHRQEKAAQELDRVAADLDRATDLARDPREAARQLARLEEGLQKRTKEEVEKKDAPALLAERLKPLESEQKAVEHAAERLSVPPLDEAADKERREAARHADRASEALQKPDPSQAEAHMGQARQALDRLADRLPPLEQRKGKALAEVARLRQQQEEIARQADKAVREASKDKPDAQPAHDELAQKLADAARRQADSAERLARTDAPNQEASRQQAQKALNRALADLMDAHPKDIPASQEEARRQLERLEQALAGKKPADEPAHDLATQKTEKPEDKPAAEPSDKPAAQSTKQVAQKLARQQRQLAQKTQQASEQAKKKPGQEGQQAVQKALEKASEEQEQLNQEASHLPADQAQRDLEQAREAMTKAHQALAKKDAAQAQQKQNEAADALERLARELPEHPPSNGPPNPAEKPEGLPSGHQAEQAREVARQQRELHDALQQRERETARAATPAKDNPVTKLAEQQQELHSQTGELGQELGQLSKEMPHSPQAQNAARQAANLARQAQAAMHQAQAQARQGQPNQAERSQEQAARDLDQAAQEAEQATSHQAAPADATADQKTGQALQQAQAQMNQTENQLSQGDKQNAETSMKEAAQSLQEAARQLAQHQPGQPLAKSSGKQGSHGHAEVELKDLPKDLQRFAGKRWGELPGELRTKLIQDMKAQYGEDYAQVIQLYFEQIADTKAKDK